MLQVGIARVTNKMEASEILPRTNRAYVGFVLLLSFSRLAFEFLLLLCLLPSSSKFTWFVCITLGIGWSLITYYSLKSWLFHPIKSLENYQRWMKASSKANLFVSEFLGTANFVSEK